MKIIKSFCLLFLLLQNFLFSQQTDLWTPPEKDTLLKMLDYMYNLEFDKFDSSFARYQKRYPDRPEARFAGVMAWWMKVTADIYNPKYDDLFEAKLDSVIEDLERYDDDDPLRPVAEFYINSATGFKAIMHVTRQNWWSAALEGRKAVKGIELALEGKIKNPDAKFGTGLYLYYADIIPHRYPILKPLFLFYPNGDKERGLKDLQEVIDNGVFAKVVAAYMYSVILYTRENQYSDAYKIMHSLVDKYPRNPTFMLWLASMASRIGKYAEAESLLNVYSQRTAAQVPFYPENKMRMVHYRYGEIYYKQGKYEVALHHLDKAIEPLEEPMEKYLERFKVYSMLQRGFCLEKLNRFDEAKQAFELVLQMEDYHNTHEQADSHLKRLIKMEVKQKSRKTVK